MRRLFAFILLIGFFGVGQTTPQNFYYSDIERTFITLNWDVVADVDGYRIYVDGLEHGTSSTNTYTVSNLSDETNYDIAVTSYIGGSESGQSLLPQIRTGLYPDEELIVDTGYNPETEPSNTTPYTNTFGLEERKVTQRSVEGDVQQLEKTYAKDPTWNRDGSVIRTENSFDFYDGNTYAKQSDQTVSNKWGWWPDNRSVRLNENKYQERSADGTTLNTIRTFNYDNNSIAPTSETTPSWDGRYWAFEGTRGGQLYMFTYDAQTDTVFGEVAIGDLVNGYTSVSAYGTYAIAVGQAGASDYFAVYNLQTLALVHSNLSSDIGHADHQVTIQGNEVLVARENSIMVMYVLETGERIEILGDDGGGDTFSLGHVSGKNFDQPGWAFFDDRTGAAYPPTDETNKRVYRKVIAVCLDENKTGYQQVLTRTYGTIVREESNSFMPTPDPTGQKVAWNNYSDNVSYSFMELYVAQRTTGENTNPPGNTPGGESGNEIASAKKREEVLTLD